MTPDDRADVLEELDEQRADEILEAIPADARRETQELLAYEPDTAGGLMTTEIVSVLATEPVETALSQVRTIARSGRREAMNTIYVTDAARHLRGVMSLRELLAAPEGVRVRKSRTRNPQRDRLRPPQVVARLIAEYDIVAIPVVSEQGMLLGMVTVDDVIDVIQEEQTEDVQNFGGLEALEEPYMQIGFIDVLKKRAGWLGVLFIGEMLTATAMQYFKTKSDNRRAAHVPAAHHELGREHRIASDIADHPRDGTGRDAARLVASGNAKRTSGRHRAGSDPWNHRRDAHDDVAIHQARELSAGPRHGRPDRRHIADRRRHVRDDHRRDAAVPPAPPRI